MGAVAGVAVVVAAAVVVLRSSDDAAGTISGSATAAATATATQSAESGRSGGASAVTVGGGASGDAAASAPRPAGQSQALPATAVSSTSAGADSVDDQGNRTTFGPANTVDGNPVSAWRATEGDGVGQELVLRLSTRSHLTSVGLIPGYDKIDGQTGRDRFTQNRRISRVSWTFDDGSVVTQDLRDDRSLQTKDVDVATTTVHLTILGSLPPADATDPRNFVAISEVGFAGLPQ